MLRRVSELCRSVVHGVDGDVGRLEDIYFDDRRWMVRHLVVDARHWLTGRRVLIPPAAVLRVDVERHRVEVGLTRSKVEQSPRIDTARPVSRQHHVTLYDYYGFPYVWSGPSLPGDRLAGFGGGDHHLRSVLAVTGYRVRALGGEIGWAEDFVLDDETWVLRHVVVSPSPRSREGVLVSLERVTRVSWAGKMVYVDQSIDRVRSR
ncbi:MAG TPA: PRC-barrel domain-containing protein [Candidatus Methylomirabilis sp.]|nr:PRC-barrel domain-containing protein [Candidatus Methylomirabilis sp.]